MFIFFYFSAAVELGFIAVMSIIGNAKEELRICVPLLQYNSYDLNYLLSDLGLFKRRLAWSDPSFTSQGAWLGGSDYRSALWDDTTSYCSWPFIECESNACSSGATPYLTAL
jgi:hypothetical protein